MPCPRFFRRRAEIRRVLFALMLLACAAAHAAAAGDARPRIPNVVLTTHTGESVRFYDDLIKGRIVAINLIYTTCRYVCPLETAKLVQVQRLLRDRMGRDIFFYSITIDPEHDTPSVLREYGAKFGAGPGWVFLTGARRDIEQLQRAIGLQSPARFNADGHLPYLLIGNDATGQWMRNSAIDNPQFIATTLRDWMTSWQGARMDPAPPVNEPPRRFVAGEYTFATRCAACHTIGNGDGIGPDLRGITASRTREWILRMILEPDRLIAERDPIALTLAARYKDLRMPNLGLTHEDATALVAYLETRSGTPAASDSRQRAASYSSARGSAADDFRPIVAAYVRIQQALHADTLEGVSGQARLIVTACRRFGEALADVRTSAASLVGVSELETARTAFATLGDQLIRALRERNAPRESEIRAAWCPMVRRAWLQKGDKVQNPFHGARMPDCGRMLASLGDVPQ